MKINELIESACHDMFNPELNLEIAKEYERIGQTASAVSFYLRAAEYGYGKGAIPYAALLRASICFEDQKDRNITVSNVILQAIAYMPERPEGYFLMSRFHERSANWQECYTWAELGLSIAHEFEPLQVDVEYVNEHSLTFEKAVSAWWIGRRDESINLFNYLLKQDIPNDYRKAITSNLEKINVAI
jgi:hypothetical protein